MFVRVGQSAQRAKEVIVEDDHCGSKVLKQQWWASECANGKECLVLCQSFVSSHQTVSVGINVLDILISDCY